MYDERDFREFFYFSILFLKKKFLFPFFLEKSLHLGLTFTRVTYRINAKIAHSYFSQKEKEMKNAMNSECYFPHSFFMKEGGKGEKLQSFFRHEP